MFIIILLSYIWVSVWLSSETFYYLPVVRTIQLYTQFTRKKNSCFSFCDFSKAFDKVWHKSLIHKMNYYGIKGPLIKWFDNYLHQRKQKVINRATSSTVCEVLIYINDIGEKLLSLSRLFADDTSLGYSSQNVVAIENVINHDLCELNTWSTKWLGTDHLTWRGVLWFFVSFRIFFSEFNIRLYDKNSESDFFFPSPKIRIFFQQHWESEYFFLEPIILKTQKVPFQTPHLWQTWWHTLCPRPHICENDCNSTIHNRKWTFFDLFWNWDRHWSECSSKWSPIWLHHIWSCSIKPLSVHSGLRFHGRAVKTLNFVSQPFMSIMPWGIDL